MKTFLRLLLCAVATLVVAHAQTVSITSPSGSVTTPVTISGSFTGGTGNITVTANGATTGLANGGAATEGTNTWSILWTPTTLGDYVIKATNGTVSDSRTLTVTGIAPSVSLALAGGGNSMSAGSSRYLVATASALGAIDRVEFYLDGQLFATSTSAGVGSAYSVLFTAPGDVIGPRQLKARAYDTAGNSTDSNTVTILVTTPIGQPPVVGLTTPQNGAFVPVGTGLTLTGSAADSDGTVTAVNVFVNGVSGSAAGLGNVSLSSTGNWTVTWNPPAVGTATITAIATDDKANSSVSPAISVNVTDATSPAISLSLSPGSSTLPVGATRNIVADVTPALGKAVVRVELFVDGTKIAEKTTAGRSVTNGNNTVTSSYGFRYTAPSTPGTSVAVIRATDNAGLARDAQQTFNVTAAVGAPPTAALVTPTNNSTVVPNTALSLAATATASGGSISSVTFYQNGIPVTSLQSPPYTASFTPGQPGPYVFDAIATDDRGNTAVSNAATVIAAFGTPTITFLSPTPNSTARATPGVPITLQATVVVPSGDNVLLVEFLLDGAQIGVSTRPTTTNGTTYAASWTPTTAQLGTHQLTARVTDTNSQTVTTASAVNVVVANLVGTPPTITITSPTASVAGNGSIQSLSTVNFIANAFATGSGNAVTSVEFFLNDVSIGVAAREQATNLYRLAYNFANYDFSQLTPDPNTGQYTLTLYAIAKDSNGNQTVAPASAPLTLRITPSSSAPPTVQLISLLGTNTVSQGTTYFMLATPNDPDGTVTSVQLFVNGAPVGGAVVSPTAQTLITYTPTTAGRFNLYVVATDDTGNTAVSSPALVLNVTPVSAPTTTITRPSDDSTVTTVNAPVFLEGTAVGSDPTQTPSLVFQITGSTGNRTTIGASRIGTTTTYRAIWTPTIADTYTIVTQATVSGVSGNSTASRRVVVNQVLGIAPVVSISFPSSVTSASMAMLTATATSASSSIQSVEFFVNRNSIGQAVRDQQTNIWRISTSFAGLTPGSYEVVALGRDAAGNVAASSTGSINVSAAVSAGPTVTISALPSTVAFGQATQLTAVASASTGRVSSVQYFVNGSSVGSSSNSATGYQVSWTPSASGPFNVYAVATDSNTNGSGIANTAVSPTIVVTVKPNNPLLDDDAFILQTYQDVVNRSANTTELANFDALITSGTMTHAQLVNTLVTSSSTSGVYNQVVNLLATYYVIMGQWPTTANYNSLFNSRTNLSTIVGSILGSTDYILKYPEHITPTPTLLNSQNSAIPASTFLARLWANAGLPGTPQALDLTRFISNDTANQTLGIGRGYNSAGVNTAVAEFVTNTNVNNSALWNKARAAALFYLLEDPSVVTVVDPTAPAGTMNVAAATAKIAALAAVGSNSTSLTGTFDVTAMADMALKDQLYIYRYVTITSQPQPLIVNPKSGAIFRVEAMGAPPISYQWLLNGSPIAAATNSLLSLTNVDASKAGTYSVVVTTSAGSATSDPATLTLTNAVTKLANISTRGQTSSGANVLIAGFVVTGTNATQTRQMLIRVVGPSLSSQGVSGFLADPTLEVYSAGNTRGGPVLTNDNWGTQTGGNQQVNQIQAAITRAGAFPFSGTNSLDAAVLATLPPGGYTVQATTKAGASGIVLIEVYDVTQSTAAGPKAANVSTRGQVGTGSNVLIAGFVVTGGAQRRMLIRGAGPTLSGLGVPGVLGDPQITLVDSTGKTIRSNDDWASGDDAGVIAAAATAAGAFPLTNGSKDSAMLVMLAPGAYTVQLSGVGGTSGVGIVEVYDVDP